jgi:hypothetical protein
MLALREYIDTHYGEKVRTHKQYVNQYSKLTDLCSQINTNKDVPCQTFIDLINESEYKTTTKLQILNLALMFKTKIQEEEDVKSLIDYRNVLRDNETTERHEKNKELIETLPTAQQLTKYMNTQFKNENWKGYIVNYILLNFYTRNLDLNVVIFDEEPTENMDHINYIVVNDNNKVYYYRNKYKTKNIYNKQEHIIKNVKFKTALLNHYNKHKEDFVSQGEIGVPLFINKNKKQITDRDIGWYVSQLTFNGIGEGNYLKVVLQNINNKPNTMTKLEKVSSLRGTSANHLIKDYNLKSIT